MKYDVIVVGAGPAGSTAAKFLSEKGINVLLIDKEKFPRDKPCGGGLPIKVLKRFDYIEKNNLIESVCYGGYVYSSSLKYIAEVKKDDPLIAMVLREKFDHGLVKLAVDSGTNFIEGKKVEDVKITDNNVKVVLDDGTNLESEVIIGADGVWSTVAEKSGLSQPPRNTGVSLYNEYPIDIKTMNQHFTEKRYGHLHLKVLGIVGYGWVFPKDKHLNIGVGVVNLKTNTSKDKKNLKQIYKDYFQLLKDNKIIPKNLEIGRIKGAALPNRPLEKTYTNRVILCGDAAGLINPLTGEGIDYSMYSGKIAATVIAEALEKGDTQEKMLSKYERLWKKDFGKDIKMFLQASKQWQRDNEKFIKLVSKDEKFSDMILEVATGNLGIHKAKWKILSYYLFATIKNFFNKD